ncbi:hypothetical protein CDAR_449981 [Caerostris darwini]|uniref:Uncharacterized protein n=1 Tax=Caerostris darwini TaxID=1538125 RepID=A0AAV4QVE2_9ARAC|nr:hypothetical protein CDAR_449981 [Caerostris darwini]
MKCESEETGERINGSVAHYATEAPTIRGMEAWRKKFSITLQSEGVCILEALLINLYLVDYFSLSLLLPEFLTILKEIPSEVVIWDGRTSISSTIE